MDGTGNAEDPCDLVAQGEGAMRRLYDVFGHAGVRERLGVSFHVRDRCLRGLRCDDAVSSAYGDEFRVPCACLPMHSVSAMIRSTTARRASRSLAPSSIVSR